MDTIVLNRELVRNATEICCFCVVDNVSAPRRSYGGALSITFRGKDNFTVRGTYHLSGLIHGIAHGDAVLIYASVTQLSGFPFLIIHQIQSLTPEQKVFVRRELENSGVGEQSKSFGLGISNRKREVLM